MPTFRSYAILCTLFAVTGLVVDGLPAQETYPVHPDSQRKPDVPKGAVHSFRFESSKVFPGTLRDYFVYVPAQYRAENPAALMVFQDGKNYAREQGVWRLPVVFDNLIASGDMPVTIAVCVNPGVVPAGTEGQDRFNRSLEYDTVSDRYATFLVDELLPEVQERYSITQDPNLRGIGGSSSGAIAAFGVAWHRPDQFRRVFSTVGTFVGLRGGNEYPTLIRKCEPKPLRVFLQDGSGDQNIYGGNWWTANQTMLSALQWAGYEVQHEWGTGGHNGKHGGAIFPDAMRWLWKDADQPIKTDISEHPELMDRLLPDQDWQLVSSGHTYTEGPAVSPDGDVFFVDTKQGEIWQIENPVDDQPKVSRFAELEGVNGLMFDAEGNLYCACNATRKIVQIRPDGQQVSLASGVACNDLVVVKHGIYVTNPLEQTISYLPLPRGKDDQASPRRLVTAARGPNKPNGLIVTPDQRFLHVVDADGRYVWSYGIESDGSLSAGQPYGYLHLHEDSLKTGADGATMTADGSLIVASRLGLQIFDQPGRVHVITSRPARTGPLSNCVFAGPEFKTLFVTAGKQVYRRKTAMTGIAPWQPAVTPPKPRL
ncbi:gluconolactonase [Roseiconus nitratireducens]|uniref:Gluconolactonase n=1 Tax=Roseiconus nitratireducens TaxID=2605748 RepID=A0A5M6DEI2_9BACT|nr:SMP-30/gluconolactonase/LRE family protein [Roseiconus nitratireducens]KAA5545938.1 gluconolactonase [Roseiconus nitratireducens]